MNENRRNIIVAVFVISGLVVSGWLVFKFGDLPTVVSRYDAREIRIFLPEAPGIQENTTVQFRGYRVGNVVRVDPPALLEDIADPQKRYYQVVVTVAISREHLIPANVVPKVCRRGLGGSFVELVLERGASEQMLKHGDEFKGVISEASDFISESTQHKLDQLITSLTDLTSQIKSQLTPLPPCVVDESDPGVVHSNVTTAVMRLDTTLKNLNVFLGDVENQRNLKKGLADFALLPSDVRGVVSRIGEVADKAEKLIAETSETMADVGEFAGNADKALLQVAAKIQGAADQMARTLNHLDQVIAKVSGGQGTVGLALNDPRLYESLTDTCENLSKTLVEMRELLDQWKKKGVKTDLF